MMATVALNPGEIPGSYFGSGPGTIYQTGPGTYVYQGSPSYIGSGIAGVDPSLSSGYTGLPVVSSFVNVLGSQGQVGPVTPGPSLPGGTAGSLTAAQGGSGAGPVSGLLASLSHTTGGLTWSHLALWLVILAGAYIVLDRLSSGKRRRR